MRPGSCVGVESSWCPLAGDDEPLAIHVNGCHYVDPADALVIEVLGFCGCGQPDLIAGAMRDYLSIVARRTSEAGLDEWTAADRSLDERFPDALARHVVEYEADRIELTEHGGSVGGAWLTDAGRLWLDLLMCAPSEGTDAARLNTGEPT